MIHLFYFKDDISNFALGCGTWLGHYKQYGSYFPIFYTYLEMTMIWSQLVGWH
jgi:hypothetical protein